MNTHLIVLSLLPMLVAAFWSPPHSGSGTAAPDAAAGDDLFAIKLKSLEGEPMTLAPHRGKVLLIVNVASKCGYTPQYAELERLHQRFKDQGLVIIGFPSNDFGGQEPGTSAEIRDFCTRQYGVTFPMTDKVRTKAGEGRSEVYRILEARTGKAPTWNFCKYLVGRDGVTTTFYASSVKPESEELLKAIEALLADAAPPAAGAVPQTPDAPRAPGAPHG